MIEFTKQWVINIVALVLFIVLFEILLPTGKMKKYVSLATGTILIIAIITPLVGLLDRNTDITALQASNSNYLDRLQIEKESKLLEKEQMKQIVGVYRDKIIEQLEQNAEEVEGVGSAKADVIFNEDYNSESFGEIKRAFVEFETETTKEEDSSEKADSIGTGSVDIAVKGEEPVKPVSRISKVRVNDGINANEIAEKCDPKIKKRLEDKISAVFGINSDNIVISQVNYLQK